MAFQKLFEPIHIGKVKIRNRVAMAPMVTAFPDRGIVSEQQMAYYAARARGGVGLIVVEHAFTSAWADDNCPVDILRIYDRYNPARLAELSDTIHAFGARTFIQLNLGIGAQGFPTPTGAPPVAASPVAYKAKPETLPKNVTLALEGFVPREMTIEEIEREQDLFAKAAVITRIAGFDGVEIHAAHGWLLHGFMSPRFNRRTDRYGGSLENRLRFLLELVRKTRGAVGSDMVVGVRVSAHEPEGTTFEDMQFAAQRLEQEGIDYLHVGNGTFESLNWVLPETDGTMLPFGAGFKKMLRIPVITPSVHDPELAERAVSEGMTDMVSLGRQLLADPEWANKVATGRVAEIRKCSRCNIGCYEPLMHGMRVKCVVNPELGWERYDPRYNRLAAIAK